MENVAVTEVPMNRSLLRDQTASEFLENLTAIEASSLKNATFGEAERCPYDPERAFCDDEDDDDDLYCDGPGARTRSKMGQEPYSKLTAPSFLVQIPFYAQKKERNRKCSVCGKHGRTPSDLLRHMRVHTGERPFPCVGCDKKFKCKRSQLTHQYLTHNITEGLSSHRLQILELKKMRRPQKSSFHYDISPVLDGQLKKDSPAELEAAKPSSVIDQDEDTEIVAGEEIHPTTDTRTTFEGYFTSISGERSSPMKEGEENVPELVRHYDDISSGSPFPDSEERPTNGFTENETLDNNDNSKDDAPSKTESPKVPILRIKTHKCTHCKRQFRSIYTLRYHLRSMHDEKVYLSPALESRLKKRRWLPPHVRLQKPKINLSLGLLLKNKNIGKERNSSLSLKTDDQKKKDIPSLSFSTVFPSENYSSNKTERDNEQSQKVPNGESLHDVNNTLPTTVKKEKQDIAIDDGYGQQNILNTDLNNNSSTLRSILTSKESLFNQLHQYTSFANQQLPGVNNSPAFSKSPPPPYVVPPHIFLPSNSQLDEGLEDNKPVSWESLRVTSENVLVTKMEAIHPTTQQKYVLYKCSQCGKAFSGLRAISVHLASHNENAGKDCEKCGASFKWQTELDSHMECHRTDRKYLSSSPFLPSYYVNPFPIPVVPTGEQAVMSTTGLLSYPFFPMPQQLSPLMQPGFFPFFAAAVQQPAQIPLNDNVAPAPMNASHSPSDIAKDNQDDKNSPQNCSFQCKLCPKTFDRIFSLQRHERIHSGVKACFCKTCGRGFSELRNLRHHIVRFHADTAKMEPLPYRRQPTRVRSSSQRLVSFLKKTAVRILNSIGQNKLDSPASSTKTQTERATNDTKEEEFQKCRVEEPQHADGQIEEMEKTSFMNTTKDTSDKTLVPKELSNYLEAPEREDLSRLNGTSLLDDTIKVLQTKTKDAPSNRPLEVLQDPKRSLLGNRRKGRPFKLTTNANSCNFLNPIADENLFAITQKILNGMPKLNIEQSNVFLPPPPVIGANVSSDLNMPQLSFFNTDPQNNEPLDMSNNRESKSFKKDKIETEPTSSSDSKTNLLSNYSSVSQINENASALTVNGALLGNSEGKCMFPCNYCHRSFSTLSDLNRHMTFHADIRPFKCPYCSYCSRTNSQLKVHMMRHEGIKHYMCQICNYNGVTQSDLNRHLKTRTHLLRSRNICACCGTGFHTRSLSEEHYKSCSMLGGTGNQEALKSPKEARLTLENKNRGNRLKHVEKPKENSPAKKEFFKNLYELGKMGVPFADFLQQSTAATSVVK